MFRNVLSALNEALDITLHLHPLIGHFQVIFSFVSLDLHINVQGIENADYTELRPLLAPLMHTVCLVYANSGYYNTTARVIVLMQVTLLSYASHLFLTANVRKLAIYLLMFPENFLTLLPSFKLR